MDHPKDGRPIHTFATQADWDAWLSENGGSSPGMWLRFAKKSSGIASVSYDEALESALCHGWIDGLKHAFDESTYLLKFTPRRARSKWSKINREKAERLIRAKRMKPAGLAQVKAAKADGRWEAAYESQGKIKVPDDLAAALATNPRARAFFETLDSANRYAILYRIHNVKKAETRARKITEFVAMLEGHGKIHG